MLKNISEMNVPGLIEVTVNNWSHHGERLHLRFATARDTLNAQKYLRERRVSCVIEGSEVLIWAKHLNA